MNGHGYQGAQEGHAWQSLAVAPMTPELEVELRTTVASLRVKTSCQELLDHGAPTHARGGTEGSDPRLP